MNQKQGLKLYIGELEDTIAEKDKHIAELENYNAKAKGDIVAYNKLVLAMIAGGCNPCDWCEEKRLGECEHQECDGKGCDDWWLKDVADIPTMDISFMANDAQIEGSLPEAE